MSVVSYPSPASSLEAWGWDSARDAVFVPHRAAGLEPARVVVGHRGRSMVRSAAGELDAAISGRFRHAAISPADYPVVGDWVAIEARAGERTASIHAVMPRATAFVRHAPGLTSDEQVVAANVDTLFLAAGLDGDLNLRRLERYLAVAWASGARPVVVLTKADLAGNVDGDRARVTAIAPGVEVHATSAVHRHGLDSLAPYLAPGATVALLGSSGVGKSTLVNALLGEERQAVAAVRADDGRGRHTTIRRELIRLPSGALLLDTPGMRELGLAGDEGLDDAFAEVAALAAGCRFADCRHEAEPGCAVRDAIRSGVLTRERLAHVRKLEREAGAAARRRSDQGREAARRFSRMVRNVSAQRADEKSDPRSWR